MVSFCGFLNSQVFFNKPLTLLNLIENIRRDITTINKNMLQKVMDSICKRIDDCVENESGYLSNVNLKN